MSKCNGCGKDVMFFDLDCPHCGLNSKPIKPKDREIKIEMYHVQSTYLEGWYSITDLKRILETAERINEINKRMAEEAKPEPTGKE
jgi:predicted DCC family thiol-disulfide oxidoreductase YuxK